MAERQAKNGDNEKDNDSDGQISISGRREFEFHSAFPQATQ